MAPLLMHNGQLADPLNQWSKKISEVSAVRKKTETNYNDLAEFEFHGSLYTKDNKVIIPAEMLEASIVNGAKKFKKGGTFKAAMYVEDHAFLNFGENIKADKLWKKKEKYSSRASARVGTNRVIRTRPKFDNWSVSFTIAYDSTLINKEDLEKALENAGALYGLGDWRPRYGRFKVTLDA